MHTFTSPIDYDRAQLLSPTLGVLNGMGVALRCADTSAERTRQECLGVCDASFLSRFGVKGSGALSWLGTQRISCPGQSNQWTHGDDGSLVLRLGESECLIEGRAADVLAAQHKNLPGVYRVARADASFLLSGKRLPALLSEVCALDTRIEATSSTMTDDAIHERTSDCLVADSERHACLSCVV